MVSWPIMQAAATGQRFYYPQLDGLRFIAFLLVFIHNSLPVLKGTLLETISEYGWIGVDLFFCLSAFLITKLLANESALTGKINIRNFYIRRILRIWPLYFFYVALALIIIAPIQGLNVNIPGHILALSTFTFNFGYFALLPSPILIIIHLWSISFEEQFYTVIPWFLRNTLSFAVRKKFFILGAAFLIGSLIRAIFIILRLPHPAVYFLPFTHFDSILGGLALGLGLLDKLFEKTHSWALPLGILCLALNLFLPNNDVIGWHLMLTYPLIGIGMSLIVFSAINHSNILISFLLKNRLSVYLGKISYGLYVFHVGSLALTSLILSKWFGISPAQFGNYLFLILGIGLILTLLLAVASYFLIEKPFLNLKRNFSYVPSRPI